MERRPAKAFRIDSTISSVLMWRLGDAARICHYQMLAALPTLGGSMNMPKGSCRRAARFCPLLAATASLLALVSSANATTLTTTAVSDLYVSDFNGDGIMETGEDTPNDAFIRVFGQGGYMRGVWEFSLAGIPTTATINSASVTFFNGGTSNNTNMLLYAYAGNGTAAPADGNNISVLAGGFAITGPSTLFSPTLDTAVIQNLVSSGASFLGLVMKKPLENIVQPPRGADFCSIEAAGYAFIQPYCGGFPGSQLTIDYTIAVAPSAVPIPPAFALFASGIAAVGLLARRRKKRA